MSQQTLRGHPIYWDGEQFRYTDTGAPTADEWAARPCGHCGKPSTPEGHDGCLGTLPGVINACCGHGRDQEAYVQFEGDQVIRGDEAVAWMREHTNGRQV